MLSIGACQKCRHSHDAMQRSAFGPKEETGTPKIRTPASSFEGFAQKTGVGKAILHDGSEPIEAKVNKVVVLSDDLSTRTREVERI